MVRAEVHTRERRASGHELIAHPRRQCVEVVFGIQAATDSGLIADNHQQKSQFVQAARAFEHTRNELKVLAPNHVAAVDVDDAIAVQESGTSEGTAGSVHCGCCSSQRT